MKDWRAEFVKLENKRRAEKWHYREVYLKASKELEERYARQHKEFEAFNEGAELGHDDASIVRYNAGSTYSHLYPAGLKFYFAICDLVGRRRMLTYEECVAYGLDCVKGTSAVFPVVISYMSDWYQKYKSASNALKSEVYGRYQKEFHSLPNASPFPGDEEARISRKTLYDQYIQSQEWRLRANRIKARDMYACRLCRSTEDLTVHHLSYNRLGNEADFDLITLCWPCHQNEHGEEIAI